MTRTWDPDLGVRVGFYFPLGEGFKKVYDPGVVFGGDFALWHVSGLGFGIAGDYFSRSGNPIMYATYPYGYRNAEAEIQQVFATVNLLYRRPTGTVRPYLGGGAGAVHLSEQISADLYFYSTFVWPQNEKVTKTHAAFALIAGVQLGTTVSGFLEGKYVTARMDTVLGENQQIGGVLLVGGVRF